MSFSTRYVSIQWALRFEFLTTPKNVDWTRYRLLDTSTTFHNIIGIYARVNEIYLFKMPCIGNWVIVKC